MQTDTYFTLTKYTSSITNTRTVTAFPPKKNLVPRFGRKTLKGKRSKSPIKSDKKQSHQRNLRLMIEAVGVC
jgi:hypothetical protein